MTLIHWYPLELKPLFLVLSILLNLKKKKTMFFLTLGRKKELDEGLTPTKDGGTCLRRLSMFRKEVH